VDPVQQAAGHGVLSLAQAAAFVAVAWLLGTELPVIGPAFPAVLLAATAAR
jgi:ABC-2 type transport system permease protein